MHWRKSMSERAGLGGLSTDAPATRDISAPRDSISSAEDFLQDRDFDWIVVAIYAPPVIGISCLATFVLLFG